jgi:hypothetical protein
MAWQGDGPRLSSTGIVYEGCQRAYAARQAYIEQERREFEERNPDIKAAREKEREEKAKNQREHEKRMKELIQRRRRRDIL